MKLPHLTHKKRIRDPLAGKSALHNVGRDPYMDWAVIVCATGLISVGLIFLGFLSFEGAVSRLAQNPTPPSTVRTVFDQKALASLLQQFDSRTAEQAKLLKEYDGPGDPSL